MKKDFKRNLLIFDPDTTVLLNTDNSTSVVILKPCKNSSSGFRTLVAEDENIEDVFDMVEKLKYSPNIETVTFDYSVNACVEGKSGMVTIIENPDKTLSVVCSEGFSEDEGENAI